MSTAEPPERLHLDYQLAASVAVVTVTGEVDVATYELLRDGLLRVVTDETDCGLVVNLAGVNFIDSTGLGSSSASGTGSVLDAAAWRWPRRPARSSASWLPRA